MEPGKILRGLSKFYLRDERLRSLLYRCYDALGIKRPSKEEMEKVSLLKEYLWRKYKMGGKKAEEVIKILGRKFRLNKLKEVLGERKV